MPSIRRAAERKLTGENGLQQGFNEGDVEQLLEAGDALQALYLHQGLYCTHRNVIEDGQQHEQRPDDVSPPATFPASPPACVALT